ncbi:MAG: hypothetical protein M3Q14_00315 [bacterium]|nr:hypothetical protein [bacterium]
MSDVLTPSHELTTLTHEQQVIENALSIIDQTLGSLAGRNLVETVPMMNDLLDARTALTKQPEPQE